MREGGFPRFVASAAIDGSDEEDDGDIAAAALERGGGIRFLVFGVFEGAAAAAAQG